MHSIVLKLAGLSATLVLTACVTTPVADTGATRQECDCKCAWTTVDGSQSIGVFTFASDGPGCSFTAVDNYVPCKDPQGGSHPGTRYYECQFMGVAPPIP